jgi:hypothetical protein
VTYTDSDLLLLLAGYLVREAKGEPLILVEWTEDMGLTDRQRAIVEVAYLGATVLREERHA